MVAQLQLMGLHVEVLTSFEAIVNVYMTLTTTLDGLLFKKSVAQITSNNSTEYRSFFDSRSCF